MRSSRSGRTASDRLLSVLGEYVSPITARSLLSVGMRRAGIPEERALESVTPPLVTGITAGLRLYVPEEARRAECENKLRALPEKGEPTLTRVRLDDENDVVEARSRARRMAGDLGFHATDQVKVATAVSELARNALSYAGGGEVSIEPVAEPKTGIVIQVSDRGPGIKEIDTILAGRYSSKTGLGLGIVGSSRLMDDFQVETAPGHGTRITMTKYVA